MEDVPEYCFWNSSKYDDAEVDEYLKKLQSEQLKNVCKGDYLWHFSSMRPSFVCVIENSNKSFDEELIVFDGQKVRVKSILQDSTETATTTKPVELDKKTWKTDPNAYARNYYKVIGTILVRCVCGKDNFCLFPIIFSHLANFFLNGL